MVQDNGSWSSPCAEPGSGRPDPPCTFWHSDFEVTFFQIQSSRLEAGVDVLGCKALCLEDVMDIRQVAPEERRKRCFCVVKMRMRVR